MLSVRTFTVSRCEMLLHFLVQFKEFCTIRCRSKLLNRMWYNRKTRPRPPRPALFLMCGTDGTSGVLGSSKQFDLCGRGKPKYATKLICVRGYSETSYMHTSVLDIIDVVNFHNTGYVFLIIVHAKICAHAESEPALSSLVCVKTLNGKHLFQFKCSCGVSGHFMILTMELISKS